MQKDRKMSIAGKSKTWPFETWDKCSATERAEIALKAVDPKCGFDMVKKAAEFAQMDSHSLREKYPCAWRGIFRYIQRIGLKTRRR